MVFVYLIRSLKPKVKWVYVGSANNVEKRLKQHNSGQVTSTKSRRPYKLIHTEKYNTIDEACAREKEIKRSRLIKENILRNIK